MKTRNLFCAAAFLSLILTIPVHAGDVQTPTFVPPPPPATTVTGESTPAAQQPVEGSVDLLIQLLIGMFSL